MSARLTLDERAELDRLRKLTEEQGEELRAWREYGREDESSHFQGWASSMHLARSPALILAELMATPEEPVSNERLLQVIESERMDKSHEPDIEIIKVHIHRVRDALKRRGLLNAIVTHYKFGYSIKAEAAKALAPKAEGEAAPDPALFTAAKLVVEKHSIGKLQPAHISELRTALDRLNRARLASPPEEVAA